VTEETKLKEVKNIHEAIVAIMEQVGYVQKVKSPNLSYTFAGERDLIAAIRPWMVAYGIYAAVVATSDVVHEWYTTAKGSQMVNTTLNATIRFTHAPSGTFIDVTARGEGSDSGDKSMNKAATCAYKYALRQTFCIETGDDPDNFSSDGMERGKAASKATGGNGKQAAGTNGNGQKVAKHSQAELVKYAASLDIQGADFVKVMTENGFKNADLQAMTRWDEMVKAIDIAAGKVATPGL
jgi:hypothetical protein